MPNAQQTNLPVCRAQSLPRQFVREVLGRNLLDSQVCGTTDKNSSCKTHFNGQKLFPLVLFVQRMCWIFPRNLYNTTFSIYFYLCIACHKLRDLSAKSIIHAHYVNQLCCLQIFGHIKPHKIHTYSSMLAVFICGKYETNNIFVTK